MRRRADLLPIMDPLFNLREACKHLALLEDHLNQPRKRCPDCIRKHFLTLEALFEEAASLAGDKDDTKLAGMGQSNAQVMRDLSEQWLDEVAPEEIAARLRVVRKKLTPLCFDLRTMKASCSTVADRYLLGHICVK